MSAWSGLFNGVYGTDTAFSLQSGKNPVEKTVARAFRRRGMRKWAYGADAVVVGATVNGGSAVTYKRVQGSANRGVGQLATGGAVTIETVTQRAASTTLTSAENTRINEMTAAYSNRLSSYPEDASGNGGGGNLTKKYALG